MAKRTVLFPLTENLPCSASDVFSSVVYVALYEASSVARTTVLSQPANMRPSLEGVGLVNAGSASLSHWTVCRTVVPSSS